jgi:ribosomal-protein-alanine N-acetyltransferase
MTLNIAGERVVLRDFTMDDVDAMFAYRSDEEVARSGRRQLTRDETVEVLRDEIAAAGASPRTTYELGITLRDTGDLIGQVGLKPDGYIPRLRRRTCELGYMLRSDYWGRGLTTEAARLLVHFGFTTLDLHRIFAVTADENPRSIRVLEKLGFRREARHVEDVFEDGEWLTSLIYALLKREWTR